MLFAILCGLLWVRYGNGTWAWIGTLFWTSLFIVVISAIPFSAGLNKSDGARFWQLFRYPEQARSWMALLAIQTEEVKGLRPREWNAEFVREILAADVSSSEYLYCQLMVFYRRLDDGSDLAALVHLENALASSKRAEKSLRHALCLEAACASAVIRKQSAHAGVWCERACKLRKPESLDVIDGAIAMCEGQYGEAAQHREAARVRVDRLHLDSGLIRFAKDKWAEYENSCKAAC